MQTLAEELLDEEPATPETIGSYTIVGVLGRGGMGVVYRGVRPDLERADAIKVLYGTSIPPLRLQLFDRERRTLASLQHPSIARIYDAGSLDDGTPYFVMEEVKGLPLDEAAEERGLSSSDRLELFLNVCDAVQHAHARGVIHRDLKAAGGRADSGADRKIYPCFRRSNVRDWVLCQPNPTPVKPNRTWILRDPAPNTQRYNWWDDPSGPTSPDNPGGSGQAVSGCCIQTIPFLTAEPDFSDNPPMVWLTASPRRENAGMVYSSFVDPGTSVIIAWESEDEVAITDHRIEFYNGWDFTWTVVAELPGTQRSFEWIVPDVGQIVNSSHHKLRVIATDPAGQEGWDEHKYFIPTGDEPGTLTVTGMLPGPFLPGQALGPLCVDAVGTTAVSIDAELSYDGDQRHIPLGSAFVGGCLVLVPKAPFISTDTARFRVNTQDGQNKVNYFFSDYFSIRPDARLGDEAPLVTLTSPLGGESFPGGGIVPIHWTATDDEGIRSIDIQVSTDGGRTWHFIAEDLPPSATSFDWQLPPSAGLSDVRIRVMVSDLHFQTSTAGGQITFNVLQGSSGCVASPGEVGGLGVNDNKVTVQWSPLSGNVTFNLARGGLNGLAAGTPASCMTSGLPDTFYDDADVPASGTCFYYLVGASNDCGSSPWGPPGLARASTCP